MNHKSRLILGIEIGGTKLQFGVGTGAEPEFRELIRRDIDRSRGAAGIQQQILETARELLNRHDIAAIGYGFGGPIDQATGRVVTSHQVDGWTGFPLCEWTQHQLGVPAVIGNDCDVAALAEATSGAGRGHRTVFYVTVGTGIGGGLVIDGLLHGADRPAVAEIGHLRPGTDCRSASATVESLASGLGMEQAARRLIEARDNGADELLQAADGDPLAVTGQLLASTAVAGNPLAITVLNNATTVLGWAIAQVMTLIAPDVVVIGGGVSMMPDAVFWAPLRLAIEAYTFGPLSGSCEFVPAVLGEDVVVHGAIAAACGRLSLADLSPPAE